MSVKRLLIGCLALLLVFSGWPVIGSAASQFPDIQGHFAEKEILQLYEQGVISGYKDGKFYPSRQVNRAEYLRMLLETVPVKEWIKGPVPFEKLSGHWAYHYVEQSYRSGLLLDMEWELADPKLGERMTRAEAALLLAAAMDLKISSSTSNPFKDLGQSSEKETNAILSLNQAGIIRGMTEDTFGPNQPLTRGQVSKILMLVQHLKEKELEQRLNLQAELAEVKGDVKVVTEQGTRVGKNGDILPVRTELQTGPQSSATLLLSDGGALYVDANSRLAIQELEIGLQEDKSGQVKAQEFKILDEAILLRGKADEKNIGLNWQTEKKVNDYSVFKARNEAVDPSGKPTVKGSKSTKWMDMDIEPGHTYHYQVVGATGPNEGLGSKEISIEVVKKASFKLWSGNVLAKVKNLFSPSSKFEVQTPTTTAGVRGTTFTVSVKPDGSSNVGVFSGSVAVGDPGTNSTGQPEVTLHSLQQATVPKPGATPDVKDLKVSENSPFIQESLAKVIEQEKKQQQLLEEKLKELEKKLQEKLGELSKQAVVAPPEKPPVEQQRSTQEANDIKIVSNDPSLNQGGTANGQGSGSSSGGGSDSSAPTISSIPMQYQRIARGQSFTLPTSIVANMSNGTTSQVNVTWSPSHADTSKAGVYTFMGTTSGHSATLKLAVEAPLGELVAVEANKPLAFAGGITLDLGIASIDPGVTVKVMEVPSGSVSITGGFQVGGKIVDFKFFDGNNNPIGMNKTATISLPVNSTADVTKSAIYYYDTSTSAPTWEYMPTTYKNGLLYATVPHFSIYGVLIDTEAPSIPALGGINSGGAVVLSFSSIDKSGIKKYLIYRDETLIGETVDPMATTYADMAVMGGQTYSYKVKAVDNLGNISGFSTSISVEVTSVHRYDTAPSWSGNTIAFSGTPFEFSSGAYNIYTMGADGSNFRLAIADGLAPALLASAGKIAFVRGHDLYVANLNGSGEQRLTSTSDVVNDDFVYQSSPAWTTDGKYLYFASKNGIEKIDVSTKHRQVIVPVESGQRLKSPSISPDGNKLVYESNGSGEMGYYPEIYLEDFALGTSKKLADGMEPAFSRDGTKISYTDQSGSNVAIMNLDGTKRLSISQNLSNVHDRSHYHHATWSADSTKIAVHTDLNVALTSPLPIGEHIFIMDVGAISPAAPTIDENQHINKANENEYKVSGTGEVGATIDVTVKDSAGLSQTAQGTVDLYGEYSVPIVTSTLQPGDITITVSQTDGVYNRMSAVSKVTVKKDVEAPIAGDVSVSENSSLALTKINPNSYRSSENGEEHASDKVGALMISFSEPIRKNSIEDVELYINGLIVSETIKYLLLSEFSAGDENQIGTNEILMNYSELKQALIAASDSATTSQTLQFVVQDLAGNPCTIDLVIE